MELLELHRAYRYTDQARVLEARLQRIDSLIEDAQKETLSVIDQSLLLIKTDQVYRDRMSDRSIRISSVTLRTLFRR